MHFATQTKFCFNFLQSKTKLSTGIGFKAVERKQIVLSICAKCHY
jgi:hypothetical protein